MSLAELFVILIVIFIVIKPERLPELSYALGCVVRKMKQWFFQLNSNIHP